MKLLKHNLKHCLTNANISENELARQSGVAQQVINRILSGENQNPKIATLAPLAKYFNLSISQLIGDDIAQTDQSKSSNLREIPLINWDLLNQWPLSQLCANSTEKIIIDVPSTSALFAVKMHDASMEPQFTSETLLIFNTNINFVNGDFMLITHQSTEMRQMFTKNSIVYKKCLNPNHKDYNLSPVDADTRYLGWLVQSRTNFRELF